VGTTASLHSGLRQSKALLGRSVPCRVHLRQLSHQAGRGNKQSRRPLPHSYYLGHCLGLERSLVGSAESRQTAHKVVAIFLCGMALDSSLTCDRTDDGQQVLDPVAELTDAQLALRSRVPRTASGPTWSIPTPSCTARGSGPATGARRAPPAWASPRTSSRGLPPALAAQAQRPSRGHRRGGAVLRERDLGQVNGQPPGRRRRQPDRVLALRPALSR
jgi:hypothetical protein